MTPPKPPKQRRDEFVAVPMRMTAGLVLGVAFGIVAGLVVLTDGSAMGWLLIAASGGPLFVLAHARRTARRNRQRADGGVDA